MVTTSTGYGKELPKFLLDHLQTITLTSIGFGREMSNLVEPYSNEAIYNGQNNNFGLQMANSQKDALNNISKNLRISKMSGRDLFQTMSWMKSDKTQDEIEETMVDIG